MVIVQGKYLLVEVFVEALIKIAQNFVCSGGGWECVLADVLWVVHLQYTHALML